MRNTYLDVLVEAAEILHDIKINYYLSREPGVGDKVEFVGTKCGKKYCSRIIITDEYRTIASEELIISDMKNTFLKVVMSLENNLD